MAIDQKELKHFQNDALNRRQAKLAKKNLEEFKNTWKLDNNSPKIKSKLIIWIAGLCFISIAIFTKYSQ